MTNEYDDIFNDSTGEPCLVDIKTGLIYLLDEFAYAIANPDLIEQSNEIINFIEDYVKEIIINTEDNQITATFKPNKKTKINIKEQFNNYLKLLPISFCLSKIRQDPKYLPIDGKIPIDENYFEVFKVRRENFKKLLQISKAQEEEIKALKKALKSKEDKGKKHTKMSIHTVTQFYGDNKQLSMFSDAIIDAQERATGLTKKDRPDSYGVVLNQSQRRVLEGILKAFTDSNYKGDEEIDKATYNVKYHPINKIAGAYSNVDKIPIVKLTQSEIINLSGHDRTQGDKVDVLEALSFLATKQFCFYWVRLKTENSKPVRDKKGDYVKEEVMEVGSILRIKTVRSIEGELKYYEIHPSAPLLDQVNNYFLLLPNDWREEVKQLTGKRGSSYTYELLLWLRLQYEQIRRYNSNGDRKKKPFKISKTWEEVAIALKMPETMYKANRKRSSAIIQEAYSVAIKLGYLIKVENNGATDVLYLNESYYPKPGELV